MIRGFKKKKSNKIKSFFKGLSLSKNFDIDYDEELHNHIPNNDLKLKTLKLCPKSTQTDFKKLSNNSSQTKWESNVRLSEYDVEYFKQLVDNNLKIHQRDILIENRRLAITRVVYIILLKISFNFNYFISKCEFTHLKQQLYNNFIITLSRILTYNILNNLSFRFSINYLKFNIHSNNLNSHIKNKLPTSNSQTNSTICNPFNECSFYCTYFCKTLQNLIFCTKFRYFNEIYRNSIRRKYSMKLKSLKEVDKHLHINVTGGGCSGFQYHFNILNGLDNNTVLIYDNDIKIFSNKESIELIKSCTLDFQEELIGSKFTLDIPNSTRKCSCGNSFEIE
ncbi:HesB-family member protein, putative [Theileria annulata]|uniref:HesB-family member protein, putative n=1 Tax=Theileria annulata TaxID=5874 RepID=Q4U986_THEAN|nr:HesB-family member protein, putative [Theileria annulata]CAI76617.1 HesB-family member protein, putative [Theileria annulata]|eukprot:XP_953242.1 HesB-family member protein, putative [Theileria annulata]